MGVTWGKYSTNPTNFVAESQKQINIYQVWQQQF